MAADDGIECLALSPAFQQMLEDRSSWFYRGEGNDTMVVGYRGQNVVLRLKKANNGDVKKVQGFDRISNSLEFAKRVFSPLMDGFYVSVGKVVALSEQFLADIDAICRADRPCARLHKSVDTGYTHGVLMRDLCFLPESSDYGKEPTFSIEIKPKCGFLPTSPHISPDQHLRYSVCYYCMLQYTKVAEGKHKIRSRYCPVNLFSRDVPHVYYALEGLVSCPQNNFRVFMDGKMVYSQEILDSAGDDLCCPEMKLEQILSRAQGTHNPSQLEGTHECSCAGTITKRFLKTVIGILIHDSNYGAPENGSIQQNDVLKPFQENSKIQHPGNARTFGHGGVLQRLHALQKMDVLDIQGLYPLYKKLIQHFEDNPSLREALDFDKNFNNLDTLLNLDLSDQDSLLYVLSLVCMFSIANTSKDCSVMITFQRRLQPSNDTCFVPSLSGEEGHVYAIGVVDLDPKEVDRVEKYNKDMLNTFTNYIKYSKESS
ncbi:predicted protein [Nematostella vectensis]|uniref:Inositol-pentakisphosphate 2-kinase n=1 Tax=Nematostella vectensis TaxID=45351 RepID=A7SXN9_NEMVE|nr:predicted protein [Nematostella vectensis]|eukprot:XP_001623620.1 predicted protein [Nematostella vectensis]